MNLIVLEQFFFVASMIGMIFYIFSFLAVFVFTPFLEGVFCYILGIKKSRIKQLNARFLTNLKTMIIVLFFIPWLSLLYIINN